MKKIICLLVAAFLSVSVFAFEDYKIVYNYGAELTSSFIMKPYIGVDICAYYTKNDISGFGCGGKIFANIVHGEDEPYAVGVLYGTFVYKKFNCKLGISIHKDLYTGTFSSLGWVFPISEDESGKVCLNVGFENWNISKITKTLLSDSSTNKSAVYDGEDEPYLVNDTADVMYTAMDYTKLYFGVTYFLKD